MVDSDPRAVAALLKEVEEGGKGVRVGGRAGEVVEVEEEEEGSKVANELEEDDEEEGRFSC